MASLYTHGHHTRSLDWEDEIGLVGLLLTAITVSITPLILSSAYCVLSAFTCII